MIGVLSLRFTHGDPQTHSVCVCVDGRFRVLVCRQMFVGMEDLLVVVISCLLGCIHWP